MDKELLIKIAVDFIEKSEENYISKEIAISENVVGTRIYEEPIFAFGSADDENFKLLKETPAIGEHFMLPNQWVPQAKTVISFFLPFSEEVKKGNKMDKVWPSEAWLHGRIEGQKLLSNLCRYLNSELIRLGFDSVVPSLDERFWSSKEKSNPELSFTSNWSERHVAFVCGLGTFGLSKGIITKKGMAGRLGSIVTGLYLQPDERKYKEVYEYCSMCGACVKKCPVDAISIENGKNHIKCSEFLDVTADKYKPRYGCGKCQVSVPCESRIPKRALI